MGKGNKGIGRILGVALTAVILVSLLSGCFGADLIIDRPRFTFPVPSGPSVMTPTTHAATVPEGNTLPGVPEVDLLPGLPEELESNIYLNCRGKGDCKAMVGDVLLTVIFASDSESTWSEARMKAMQTQIWAVEERMEQDAATWGAELELTVEFKTATATAGQLALNDNKEWIDSVMRSAGLGPREEVNQTLEAQRGVDEAPVAIFVDRSGRSFASSASGTNGAEYAVCYENADALYHELNHVFGAKDFYYPTFVKEQAQTHLQNSIMISSGEGVMESLTAYLIGWTDTPSEQAVAFLRATASLTKEQLDEEREREQYTGYVTDFQKGDAIYTGYLVDGQLHGYGTRTSLSGDSYTGDWDHGIKHGTGTYNWANGDSYSGTWVDGSRTGTGTYTWASGNSYTGDWVNGDRTGKGTWTSADGECYVGDFVEGSFHGQGTYTWSSGNSYTGSWVEGKRTGKGTWVFARGDRYVGDFQDGKFHGQGTYTWANGDSYTGSWVDDSRNGYGVYQWTNGTKYEGQFVNDQRHGQGTMTYANGAVESGLWENGDFKG